MGYNPRHALVKAAHLMSPRKWLATGSGLAAVGVATAVALAGGAGATVSPTVTPTATGVAGYYAAPNANRLGNGDKITGVRSTFYLRKVAENNAIQAGVELCRYQNIFSLNTQVVDEFTVWNGTSFNVEAADNTTTSCLDGLNNTANATTIDTIPAGHTAQLEITQDTHHLITFVDSDQTTQTGGRTTFGGFTFLGFDRAGVGTNGEQGSLTTPATIDVARFTKSAVRDAPGWADLNRAGLTRLVVNKVDDTTSGTSSGGVLEYPSPLGTGGNDGSFTVYMGQLSNS